MYSFLRSCEATAARFTLGAERDGAKEAVELLLKGLEQRAARDVAVRDLLPLLIFKLKEGLAAQGERPHGDARVPDARDRLGENELGERAEALGKVGQDNAHAPNLSLSARCAAYSSFLL